MNLLGRGGAVGLFPNRKRPPDARKERVIMCKAKPSMWRGFVVICILLLCASGGRAGDSEPTSQPASQPAVEPQRQPGELARERLERAADTLRLMNRIQELERTVSELSRHLGGPTRNLTRRPDTDLPSWIDRVDRDLRSLQDRASRMQRDVESLARRVDRLERRR